MAEDEKVFEISFSLSTRLTRKAFHVALLIFRLTHVGARVGVLLDGGGFLVLSRRFRHLFLADIRANLHYTYTIGWVWEEAVSGSVSAFLTSKMYYGVLTTCIRINNNFITPRTGPRLPISSSPILSPTRILV